MPTRVRVYRPEMVRDLARLKRTKWSKLPYCNFVIQAESEINPDFLDEPDVNFSEVEAVGAFITPIPLRYRTPNTDIRIYIDDFGRPNLYHIRFFRSQRVCWNQLARNHARMIYPMYYDVTEITKSRTREVTHTYLQTLRGQQRVRQLDTHLINTIEGLEDRRLAIQTSIDTNLVDRAIAEVLDENRRIQNGSI